MNEVLHYYDCIVSVVLTNLIEKDKICLGNFNFKDKSHLCIFEIAKIAHDVYHLDIEVDLGLFNYWKFIIEQKCRKIVRRNHNSNINCEMLVKKIEEVNQNPEILAKIYDTYYKK